METFFLYHEIVCCVYSLDRIEAILMSTLNIPLLYRRSKRLPKIIDV